MIEEGYADSSAFEDLGNLVVIRKGKKRRFFSSPLEQKGLREFFCHAFLLIEECSWEIVAIR